MTENEENKSQSMIDLESKFWRTTLLIISVLLIFAGPTYVPYVLYVILGLNYIATLIIGAVLLAIGLVMLVYLIRKKVVT
jgi:hypothetical protein